MKLATYLDQGQERWGLVLQNPWDGSDWIFPPKECVELLERSASNATNGMFGSLPSFHPQGGWPDDLAGFLALEEAGMALLSSLEKHLLRFWKQADRFALESAATPVSGATLCAPIPRPRLMWGLVQNSPSFWRNKPERRIANFMPQGHQRPIGSTLGHLGIRKYVSGGNVELGVVIGKKGRDIPVTEAMRHVAGYTVVIDGQINGFYEDFDPRFPTNKALIEHYDWFVDATGSWAGKMSDAHCVMGPYLVTADEVGNPYDLLVYTLWNDVVRDRSHTAGTSIGIERTIHWYSTFATLHPGDVIHMGTVGTDGIFALPNRIFDRDTVIQGEIECLGRVSGRMLDLIHGPDWRTEAEKAKPFSPAAQYYVDHGLETLRAPWTPAAANHVWTCYANYRQAEAVEGFLPTPSPRFLNGPNSMLAASGETVTLAGRATTVDVGIELGCVIGKLAFGVQEADADAYILGYAPVISLSDRSFREQIIEPSTPQERNICQVYARWGDGYNIVGAPAAELPESASMRLSAEGLGELSQSAGDYLHGARAVIAFITRYITLFPGDVILLGRTEKQLTLSPEQGNGEGLVLTGTIEGLGTATVRIRRA